MIDEKTVNGGITFDENGAYAILMTESDEVHGKLHESNLASCTYRTRCDDRGRYILSKPDAKREPVRVLRSHKLVSLHCPKVGVRYDGLYVNFRVRYSRRGTDRACPRYKVTGWIISTVESVVTYDIRLARLEGQISIEKTCTHPNSEEVEDYMEYKRIRAVQRTKILDKRFVEVETTSLKETSSSAVEKPSDFPPLQQPIASSGHTNALIFDNTPSVAESDAATQGPQKSLLNTLLNRSMTVWKRQISTGPSKRDSLVEGQMEVSLRGGGDDSDAFECTSTGEQLPEDGRTDSLMEDRANNFAEAIGDGALTEYCSRRRTSSMLDEANSYQVDDFGELQAVDPSDGVAPGATRPHSLSGTTCVDEFETHISGRSFPVSMSNEVDGDNWDPRAIPGPSHGSYQLERNDRLYAPAFADSPVASPELLPRARSSSAPGASKTLTFEGLPKPASYEETRSKSQGRLHWPWPAMSMMWVRDLADRRRASAPPSFYRRNTYRRMSSRFN